MTLRFRYCTITVQNRRGFAYTKRKTSRVTATFSHAPTRTRPRPSEKVYCAYKERGKIHRTRTIFHARSDMRVLVLSVLAIALLWADHTWGLKLCGRYLVAHIESVCAATDCESIVGAPEHLRMSKGKTRYFVVLPRVHVYSK